MKDQKRDKQSSNDIGIVGKSKVPTSVLFLCNHNVIRSTMGEALLKQKFGKSMFIDSAGVRTGEVDPFVTAAMAELDVDVGQHHPKALNNLEDTWFDLIITLSPTAHHVALMMEHVEADEVIYWPSGDPTVVTGSRDQVLAAYRDVREGIAANIKERFGS